MIRYELIYFVCHRYIISERAKEQTKLERAKEQNLLRELSITVLDAFVESENPRMQTVKNAYISSYAYSLESLCF